MAALEAGRPPDFVFSLWLTDYVPQWALDDRLIDLTNALGPLSNLFDPDVLEWGVSLNAKVGEIGLYGLPIGQATNHQRRHTGGRTVNVNVAGCALVLPSLFTARTAKRYRPGARFA